MLALSSHSTTSSQITKGVKAPDALGRSAGEKFFRFLSYFRAARQWFRCLSQANECSSQKTEFVSAEIFLLWAQLYSHTMSL